MIRKNINKNRLFNINESYEADPLEITLAKITTQGLPIEATSPTIFTERKDGVQPQYDIRTDRWEIAENAMGHVSKTSIAKRENPGKSTNATSEGETTE